MKLLLTATFLLISCVLSASSGGRSQAEQQAQSPAEVLAKLMAGNERFQAGNSTQRNLLGEASRTAAAQHPIAVIVSCLDSRVPVEMVFDQGIGDLFVGRVAGNVEGPDMVGSLEFASRVSGARVIMVMGHDSCGAVRGAIANVELGNLTGLLEKIAPAEEGVVDFDGPRTADNMEYVNAVGAANVIRTIEEIREMSPIIRAMEEQGEVMLVGTFYTLSSGKVSIVYPEELR